jgi:hypothetical protein
MRNLLAQVAALLTIVVAAAPNPASATTTSTAIAICVSRGADCSITNKGDNYELCVNNTGGQQCVSCPNLTQKDQTCTVALTGGGGRPRGGVVSVLGGEERGERISKEVPKP